MKNNKITYAKARLTLGICYVGLTVLIATLLLTFSIPQKLLSLYPEPTYLTFKYIFSGVFIFECLSFIPDIAGFTIDRIYKRTSQTVSAYLKHWLFSSFNHALILIGLAALTFASVKLGGITALGLTMTVLSFCLIWKQAIIARFLSGVTYEEPSQDTKADFLKNISGKIPLVAGNCNDRNFTGGIVGFPGKETLVLPGYWLDNFSYEELFAEVTRRNQIIETGSRTRGVYFAIAFNVLGILLAALISTNLSSVPLDCAAGLLSLSLYFTLWSFLGLLVLPRFSHLGVFEADYLALKKGVNPNLLANTIRKIDKHMEDEFERRLERDVVFHPIPSTSRRIERIHSRYIAPRGAWNLARYTILLSILGLGLLGKAVHCNAGRPNLWVLLPCD